MTATLPLGRAGPGRAPDEAARRAPEPPAAAIRSGTVRYGGRTALDAVSLSLHPGEVYALLGPNGAGKTTLMRALCGRVRLDSGRVEAMGGDPARDARARRSIGLVPQEIALYPKLTVRENLEVFARLAGLGRRVMRDRVEAILDQVRAGEVAASRVETLSGGYQRRANIGVALLEAPRLLLLDEPTVGVDVDARGAIHEIIRELARGGTAVLIATHDFEQAEALADRVGLLLAGRLALEGALGDLLGRAFGEDAKDVRVLLGEEPSGAEAELLARLGLMAVEGRRTWAGRVRTASGAIHLQEALERGGIAPREVRMRRPGLDGLFLAAVEEGRR